MLYIRHMVRFSRKPFRYERRPHIMTAAERQFYLMLVTSFGDQYYIFPQVHLSAIFNWEEKRQSWVWARRHIENKSVDYLLCDKTTLASVVAIELDDWSHKLASRRWRDNEVERIFHETGMPLVRFHDYQTLDREVLERKVSEAIAE